MNFKQIDTDNTPKVIGVKNGVYQVELNEEENFKEISNLKLESIFNQTDINTLIENQNNIFDIESIFLKGILIRKAKQTDLMNFSPAFLGFEYIISDKMKSLLIRSTEYSKSLKFLEVNIENTSCKNYLMFVPFIPISEVIFDKSIIYTRKNRNFSIEEGITFDKEYLDIKSYSDFINLPFSIHNDWEKIVLPLKYKNRNILNIQSCSKLFFSEEVVENIEQCKLSNIRIIDKIDLEFV